MIYLHLFSGFIYFLILPGFLLFLILYKERDWYEIFPVSFSLSILFFTIPGIIAYVLHPTYKLFLNIYLILIVLEFILFILIYIKRRRLDIISSDNQDITNENTSLEMFPLLIIVLASLFFITVMVIYKGCITTDGIGFLGYIKKLAVNPIIKNQDGFYKEIIVDTTYGYNIWFLLIAFISRIATSDPVQVWIFLPMVLTPLIILSFYTLSKTLFRNTRSSITAVFMFLLFFGINEGCWIFRTSPYPMIITDFLIHPIVLTFAFKYLYKGQIQNLIISGLLGLSLATVHLGGLYTFILILLFFLIFEGIFERNNKIVVKRLSLLILFSILFSLPYIFLRLPHLEIKNYAYFHFFIKRFSPHIYCVPFDKLFCPHYHVKPPFTPRGMLMFSFILSPFILIWVKKHLGARYLIANMWIPPLIILNPYIVPILNKIIPFALIGRISQILPFILILGIIYDRFAISISRFLQDMWEALFNKDVKTHIFYGIILLITLGILVPIPKFNHKLTYFVKGTKIKPLSEWTPNFVENPYALKFHLTHYEFMPSLKFIRRHIKKTSVFLSDEEYGSFIGIYTRHFSVIVLSDYASAAAPQKEREQDALKVLDFDGTLQEILKILRKYEVNYIVLTPKYGLSKTKKFEQYPAIFQEIYRKNGIIIYKILN